MVLTGSYEHTIDTKNRIAIPVDLRAAIQRSAGGGDDVAGLVFYVNPSDRQDALRLFPEAAFEKRAAELEHSELPADELLAYEEVFFGLSFRVETDKQGRVRLPETLLDAVAIGRDVAVVGQKDHIVLMPQEAWRATKAAKLGQKQYFRNPRAAMRLVGREPSDGPAL
ncbi:division/cell wall cluster transcriptional repressor MraZ [Mucisphaera sp.]|uniref:division/cell wall cluster transcriptional repressor MraZ n=1 Tax=Mucisphaera sp. TaxID=2913024 RepID=UPI003D1316D1